MATRSVIALLLFAAVCCLTGCSMQASEKYKDLAEYADINFVYDADSLYNTIDAETGTTPYMSRRKKLAAGYRRTFNDLNDIHLQAAIRNGIKPLEALSEADSMGFWTLARIDSCRFYKVEKLTHSVAYLTPQAKWLLMNIGKNCIDSLAAHDVSGYQIIVTSLLRTDDSIRRLRRRNSNASENSAHRFGTTFDISYIHYNRTDTTSFMPEYRLKEILAEVLYDLRAADRCYVKYEVRQGCFHITAR